MALSEDMEDVFTHSHMVFHPGSAPGPAPLSLSASKHKVIHREKHRTSVAFGALEVDTCPVQPLLWSLPAVSSLQAMWAHQCAANFWLHTRDWRRSFHY